MINHFRVFLITAIQIFKWRLFALIGLMVFSALLEGLAITAALPLLKVVGSQEQVASDSVGILSVFMNLISYLKLPEGVLGVGLLMVSLITLSAITFLAQTRLAAKLQANYVIFWQESLFASVLNAGPRMLDHVRAGDIVSALVADANRVSGAFYHSCIILASIVNLIIYSFLAFLVSPLITLFIVILGATLFVSTRTFLAGAYKYGFAITKAQADIQTLSGEFVSQIKALKTEAAEDSAFDAFKVAAKNGADLNFLSSYDVQKARAIFEFGGAAGIAAILIVGPLLFHAEVAVILIILALFVRLLPRITALQQGLQALSVLLPGLVNLQILLGKAKEISEPVNSGDLPENIVAAAPEIKLSNILIKRGERIVIDGVSLTVPSGKITAFVGPSGSGKTTLVNAILGLISPDEGVIWVGGHNLANLPMKDWRRQVGYVAQDTQLFTGTVESNVGLGMKADQYKINNALRLASAGFVFNLEKGIKTLIGNLGAQLSGGERQRIGLARAFSGHRRVYVLDEATSALDSETERDIITTVSNFSGDATIIMIAHRFSALKKADVIYVLEEGCIVEQGDWKSLDVPGTRFYALKQLQEMTRSEDGQY